MEPQTGPQPADPIIGQTIGNYLVIQKLGEGGMGTVYLGEHPTIGKRVALKILHPEFSTDTEVTERFFTEARAVNAIAHPNIVDIVDYGVIEQGDHGRRLVYITMEYLQGQTLAETLRAEAPLSPERAFSITIQVASALAASHRCNIVHRDLKPDNIMLTSRGGEQEVVKLLDFGIAKLSNDGQVSRRTRTGLVLGTPAYMSPEQCEGSASVDQRADVYALGICLYEMLVGRVPFVGDSYGEVLVQHLTQLPIAPSHYRLLPAHVEQVVVKALEKRREQRYPTMDEFARALADPIGYVETHGGLGEFLSRELAPSSTPVPHRIPSPQSLSNPLMRSASFPSLSLGVPPAGGIPATSAMLSGPTGQSTSSRSMVGIAVACAIVAAGVGAGLFWLHQARLRSAAKQGPVTDIVMSSTSGSVEAEVTGPKPAAVAAAPRGSAASLGSRGPVAASLPDRGAGGVSTSVRREEMVTLQVNSNPEGAQIFLNNKDTGRTTYAKLQFPRSKKSATITLRLKGYEDFVIPRFALDRDEITKSVTLRPVVVRSVPQSAPHSTSSSTSCDTCLERPE